MPRRPHADYPVGDENEPSPGPGWIFPTPPGEPHTQIAMQAMSDGDNATAAVHIAMSLSAILQVMAQDVAAIRAILERPHLPAGPEYLTDEDGEPEDPSGPQ